tara:strand:- start:570 stop:758 length:189 start_codon:yes stop_codon:yes gene_type:complete
MRDINTKSTIALFMKRAIVKFNLPVAKQTIIFFVDKEDSLNFFFAKQNSEDGMYRLKRCKKS